MIVFLNLKRDLTFGSNQQYVIHPHKIDMSQNHVGNEKSNKTQHTLKKTTTQKRKNSWTMWNEFQSISLSQGHRPHTVFSC